VGIAHKFRRVGIPQSANCIDLKASSFWWAMPTLRLLVFILLEEELLQMSISENSDAASTPAVRGENTGGGTGVYGISPQGRGIEGWSTENYGVTGDSQKFPGVRGTSVQGRGIEGWSTTNDGVWGISSQATGVHGVSENSGTGIFGESKIGRGVHGQSETWQGVFGSSRDNAGIVGESVKFHAVFGISHDVNNAGLFGTNDVGGFGVIAVSETGIGIAAKGGRLAGRFEGDVEVTGDIRLTNADCAEDFDIAGLESVEPGTVMVIDSEGALRESDRAYDKRVAGVISGAGNFKPGIVLDKQESSNNRMPIALLGKVYCKVDAQYGAIEVGDLLTTSSTPGHAMKTCDPLKAFGAVIGKALRPLTEGQGLIPILIALQ
jgi:hypothetical protein